VTKRIGILMFNEMEELDAVGPWEVFGHWTKNFPEDEYELVNFSREGGVVTCAKGLRVVTEYSYATVPELEVLVYPGGFGTRAHLKDLAQLAWLREQRTKVPMLVSVCTGSLVFASAGLLKGRRATTHWASLDLLAQLDSTIEVCDEERIVDEGDLVTSAGVSAGIDMALHLVRRFVSSERAIQVRRGIQYDPRPPV
jgi:transcriptional regulator GlxA family with amidase domain